MSRDDLIRDSRAEANARRDYTARCSELFDLEDHENAEHHWAFADQAHAAALIIGKAARSEMLDNQPRGLR